MPGAVEILGGLTSIANGWRCLATAWHVYLGALALGLALGERSCGRLAGVLIALLLLSVSAVAWAAADPFNGVLLALLAVALIAMATRLPAGRIRPAPLWALIAGAMMFALGWVYPHFLEARSPLTYLYAAPTGAIPCPTLSIVIGLALVTSGLRSRAWSLTLGAVGTFYGLTGALLLGVALDWALLAGALLLVAVGLTLRCNVRTGAAPAGRGRASAS